MTYNVKKDHLKKWELPQINENSTINVSNDDDQDIYISERSSIASSNDLNPTATIKRLPTPTPSPPITLPQKQPHMLRYPHTEFPENGIPSTTQHKEDKKKKKNLRKSPPNQGSLTSFPETKLPELCENYNPYWSYYKAKNPDWIMRNRRTSDDRLIPYESFDPALTTSSIKPRQQQQQPRKSHHNAVPIIHANQDPIEKNLFVSPSKQYIPSKDADNDEHRTKRTIPQQRRKLKTENDCTDHCAQPPQDSNSLIITSSSLTNRPKNRSKISDENNKHRHPNNPPSQQNHHHQHHLSHLHIRRRPPSGAHLAAEFQVVDVSFKKSERAPYFQQVRESFHSPSSPNYTQSPHFPPIIADHHHKTNTTRFPTEYYGTLARQAHGKDWQESIEIPKIYKHDSQSRFHDRYLHNVVDKRLVV